MFLNTASLALLVLSLALPLSMPESRASADDEKPADEPAAKGPPKVAFTEPAAQAEYERAIELFARADWKASKKLFQACRKNTDKTGKGILGDYIDACAGGKKLDKTQAHIAKRKWRKAWAAWVPLEAKYAAGPLAVHLEEARLVIEPELFYPLATYEEDSPKTQRGLPTQDGRGANTSRETREAFVKRGTGSLRWRLSQMAMGMVGRPLTIARFESTLLEKYRYLRLSIYSPDKDGLKLGVFFDQNVNEGTQIITTTGTPDGYFHSVMLNRKGWIDVRIDLQSADVKRAMPDLEEIHGIYLMSLSSRKNKTVYIDEVKLEVP